MGLVLSSANSSKTRPNPRHRHPLLLSSAALSIIVSSGGGGTFISAFAASPSLAGGLSRGGNIRRGMSVEKKTYPRAPPLATVSPFSRSVNKVVIVGGTHGNEYTVSYDDLQMCFSFYFFLNYILCNFVH
jgi:hypothetical protein